MDNLIDFLKDFWVLLVPIIIGAVSSFMQKDKKQAAEGSTVNRQPVPDYSYNAEREAQKQQAEPSLNNRIQRRRKSRFC